MVGEKTMVSAEPAIRLCRTNGSLRIFASVPSASGSFVYITSTSFSIFLAAGRKVFRDFLKCEYSEENILFWLACEDLKQESNPEMIEEKARAIYEDYISILSPKEVRRGT